MWKCRPVDFENDISDCLKVLQQGGIILYPTDTVWGLGCDATNSEAVRKLFELKLRPSAKSMIILLADIRDINRYTSSLQPFIYDYLLITDRPTTVIYEGALGLADNLIADDGSVAIRVVLDDFCRHLIKRFRKPVVSTSANISGTDSPLNFTNISDEIKKGADYVVKYRQNDQTMGRPSRLVRFNKTGQPVILRN